MQTLGFSALMAGTLMFLYPLVREELGLPFLSLNDSRLIAGMLLTFAGVTFLVRRRS